MTKIERLKARAEAEDPDAMFELAWAYQFGEGVEKDKAKAKYWFEKRFPIVLKQAEAGDADAMCGVGAAYLCGWGVERDLAKAGEWDEKATKQEQAE